MSFTDRGFRRDGGGHDGGRSGGDAALADLTKRLAETRRAGGRVPEELERLVSLLSQSGYEPGERLTSALEGLARWSGEGPAAPRADETPDPQDAPRARRQPLPAELEKRLADFADSLTNRSKPVDAARAERRATAALTGAPLRNALAEISARQQALYAEDQTRPPQPPAPRPAPSFQAPSFQAPSFQASEPSRWAAATETPRPAAPAPRDPARSAASGKEKAYAPARTYAQAFPQQLYRPTPVFNQEPAGPAPSAEQEAAQLAPSFQREPVRQAPAAPSPVRTPVPEPASNTMARELRAEIDRLGRAVGELPGRAEVDGLVREMAELARRVGSERPARLDRDSLRTIDALVAEVDRMRGDAASPQMIAGLSSELQAISGRLDALGPRSVGAIDTLARRIDEVRADLSQFPRAAAVESVSAEIQSLIGRLDAQERAAQPTRDAVLGLSGRVEALDGKIAAIHQASVVRDDAFERINSAIRAELTAMPRAEAVSDLGRQLDALNDGLKSRSAIGPAITAVEGLSACVRALDEKLDMLASRKSSETEWLADTLREEIAASARPEAFDGLGRQIDALSVQIAANRPEALGGAVAVLAGKVDGLGDRMERIAVDTRDAFADGLAAYRPEPVGGAITTLSGRIDGLGERMERIAADTRDALADGLSAYRPEPVGGAIAALSGKIDGLGGRIDQAADASRRDAIEQLEAIAARFASGRPDGAIGALSGRIDGIGERIEGLGDRMERIASTSGESALRRIDDLAAKLESQRVEPSVVLATLQGKLDGLGEHIEQVASATRLNATAMDQLEALAARLASGRTERPDDGADTLVARFDLLGERMDVIAAATAARSDAFERIEDSVRSIADQLITARPASTEAGASALEFEVARVLEGLDRNDGRLDDLNAAFSGLAARIERSCAGLGAHCVETAVTAARDALGSGPAAGGRLDEEIARALDELRAATTQSERRSADTLESFRTTLDRLLDRMEDRAGAAPAPSDRLEPRKSGDHEAPDATAAARAAARRALEEIASGEEPPAPRLPRIEAAPFANYADFAPDHPIEPGSKLERIEPRVEPRGEPQIQPQVELQPESPSRSTASLIAAARRAHSPSSFDEEPADTLDRKSSKQARKAAKAEARAAAREDRASAQPSRLGGIIEALKARRRPLALGVAATLIVFAALYVASGMTGNPEETALAPAPQTEVSPAPAPTAPADAAPAPAIEPRPEAPASEAPRAEDVRPVDPKPTEPQAQDVKPRDVKPQDLKPSEAPAAPQRRSEAAPAVEAPAATASIPPRAPARDLTSFAFAESAPKRTEWKVGESATTGSISRSGGELSDEIGGPTLRMRAASGDPAAQLEIGDRLLEGRNVEADATAAAAWLEKAAAQGLAPAQHRLGSIYEKGRGVARDVQAARRWYEQAAASGNVRAMHNLGVIHAEGGLGKPDFNAAAVWFRMAAERGLVDSQYNLAVLCARGMGGKRDLMDAYKWFSLAAAQGDDDAGTKRDEVAKSLGSSLAVAKESVASFAPRAVDPAANDVPAPPGGWDLVAETKTEPAR